MKAIKDISIPSKNFGCHAWHELTEKEIKKITPAVIKRLQSNGLLSKAIKAEK